jgi:DNA-binding protein HU-beta
MNKKEMIEQIAQGADLTKAQAEQALNAFTDAVTKEMANGGSLALTGFGTFQVKERAARSGRNPQTGETIQIAAAKIPGFKAGKVLKDAVNS